MTVPAPRRLPEYRHYKPKNLAVVRIDGRDVYLGAFDSPESHEKYRRVVAEWLTAAKASAGVGCDHEPEFSPPTEGEIFLAFWTRHAETYYLRADGTPTGEHNNFRHALRPLNQLYGHVLARDFGPLASRSVRQAMIDPGLCRNVIRQRLSLNGQPHLAGIVIDEQYLRGSLSLSQGAVVCSPKTGPAVMLVPR